MEKNTAKLTIENNGHFSFIYFDKGQIVHAEAEPDVGEKAVSSLMHMQSGQFKVESGIRAPARTIHKNWSNLLLESLHQLDTLDEGRDQRFDHLFEKLLMVKGIKSVLIIDNEGEILGRTADCSIDEDVLLALSFYEGEKVGEVLTMEKPDFMSVSVASQKYVICRSGNDYVVMELDSKIKLNNIITFIQQAFV